MTLLSLIWRVLHLYVIPCSAISTYPDDYLLRRIRCIHVFYLLVAILDNFKPYSACPGWILIILLMLYKEILFLKLKHLLDGSQLNIEPSLVSFYIGVGIQDLESV